ncbi:unnamed protein product [Mytilus edulis]|uniref:Uncharacterized protein n=1 Tax=Mytilus edulis TaxID=6550 RepID=A0A8S3PYA3_MYTED|nr:unnamed protein product [Mytilus edulis]
MCKLMEIVQIFYKCLLKCDDENCIISLIENTCRSHCEDCIAKNKNGDVSPCTKCKDSGHMYNHPAIQASMFEDGEKCEKLWVAIWTSDCKFAMDMFENKKTSGTLPIAFNLMEVCPGMGRLHYPVDVSIVAEGFQTPTSLAFMNAFAFICESSVPCTSYVDITRQLSLKIYALNKQELMQKCQELDLVDAEVEDSQFTKKNYRKKNIKRELNKLFAVDLESKEGRHIGENSEQKSSDGESMSASHSKPLGLCVEQKNNYVTDGASKAIRMVSNTIGLTNVLERLKLSFEIFSIHDRRENDESRTHTLDEAVDNLISDGHCFDGCIDFTRDTTNKPSLKPQGTEGSVAFKTVESIHMITNCLRSLDQNLQFKLQVSYGSHINLLSMLTLQVKHHFSNMRNRYPSPMVLQYGQQLLSTTKETIKRSTNTGYNYFTHRTSFYPLSKQSPAFSLMEFPKRTVNNKAHYQPTEKMN